MNNEQKERLIELIIQSVDCCARNWAETIADYLLENGVVVLPCKVGDIVHSIGYSTCHRGEDLPDSYMCSDCEDEYDMKKIVKSRKAPSLSFIVENFIDHNNYYLTYAEAEETFKRSETK